MLAGSILLAALLAEVALRLLPRPANTIPRDKLDRHVAQAKLARGLLPDAELGHVPNCNGQVYDAAGLLRGQDLANALPRAPGRQRVLFLGDSVTARACLVNGIRSLLPTDRFDWLNAGVDAWNPVQEVAWYLRHQRDLAADHIVLTLHNNDFTTTPVALYAGDTFLLCSPDGLASLNPDLYRYSRLYRLWFHARNRDPLTTGPYLRHRDAVSAALRNLRDEVASRNARLTVLLFPILLPLRQWTDEQLQSRQQAQRMLDELGIRGIDLLPPLEEALAAGLDVQQPNGDPWHPSPLGGWVLARHALAAGLFDTAPLDWVTADRLRVSPGEVQRLSIDAGPEHGLRPYLIAGSTTVAGRPGELLGHRLPFAIDSYTEFTLRDGQQIFLNGKGLLDATGRASVTITPVPMPAEGRYPCQWHACAILDDAGRIARVSAAVPLWQPTP